MLASRGGPASPLYATLDPSTTATLASGRSLTDTPPCGLLDPLSGPPPTLQRASRVPPPHHRNPGRGAGYEPGYGRHRVDAFGGSHPYRLGCVPEEDYAEGAETAEARSRWGPEPVSEY